MDVNPAAGDFPFLFPPPEKSAIFVITGGRGAGKTTWCEKAVAAFRQAGLKVSGLLSPGRYENGRRTGIFTIDLATHASRLLASFIPGEIEGFNFGPGTFDPQVFEWGNRCLLASACPDVLVIDELGYLEFDLNQGWSAGFEVLHKKEYRMALVIIRPECIESFQGKGFSFQVAEL